MHLLPQAALLLILGAQLLGAIKPPSRHPAKVRNYPVNAAAARSPRYPPHPLPPRYGGQLPHAIGYGRPLYRPRPSGHGYNRARTYTSIPTPTEAVVTTTDGTTVTVTTPAPPTTTTAPSIDTEAPSVIAEILTTAVPSEENEPSPVYFPISKATSENGATEEAEEGEGIEEGIVEEDSEDEVTSEDPESESESVPTPAAETTPSPPPKQQPYSPLPNIRHHGTVIQRYRPYNHLSSGGRHRRPQASYRRPHTRYYPRSYSKPKTYFASGKKPESPNPTPAVATSTPGVTVAMTTTASPSTTETAPITAYTTSVPLAESTTFPVAESTAVAEVAETTTKQPTSAQPSDIFTSQSDVTETQTYGVFKTHTYDVTKTQTYDVTREIVTPTESYIHEEEVQKASPHHAASSTAAPATTTQSSSASSETAQKSEHTQVFIYGNTDDDDSGIPGRANIDYPTMEEVPVTSFTCDDKIPGYYADEEANCQVWHYCGRGVSRQSFLCPVGTVYSQTTRVCDWWFNVNCSASKANYGVNADLYHPAPAPQAVYGRRRDVSADLREELAPQPFSLGPHEYHALPRADNHLFTA